MLLGTFRPTILIPPDLDRPESGPALRLALLHELAHSEGADPWFGLANELASVVWFWLPPLRWIGRQMRLDQEFLADRRAADRLGASSRYASTLVEIAASASLPRAGSSAPAGAGSALLQRVLMLVRSPFPVEVRPPRWWRGSLGVATALILLLATGLTLRARTESAPASLPETRSLSIPRVVLEASSPDSSSIALPIRLPKDFDLTFEVVADADEFSEIRVLGPTPRPGASPPHAPAPHPPADTSGRAPAPRRGPHPLPRLRADDAPLLGPIDRRKWLAARAPPSRPTVLRESLRLAW